MGAATSTEAHDYATDFDCDVCHRPDFAKKAGAACDGCPAFTGSHYFPLGEGVDACDVLVVGDVPELPPLALLKRNEGVRGFYHQAFTDDGGKVVRSTVAHLQADLPPEKPGGGARPSPYRGVQVRYVYAVKCAVDKPNKDTVEHCNTPLLVEIGRVAEARRQVGKSGPLVFVATGAVALRSLGVHVQNFDKDAAGRVFEVAVGSVPAVVVATMSLKAMAAQAGKASSIVSDVRRAFDAVLGQVVKTRTRAEVEAGYVYPYTNADVTRLVDEILAYTEGDIPPEGWAVAFDTETNTLHPHRHGSKWITATFSWAEGRACSIALHHPGLHAPRETAVIENGVTVKPEIPSPYAADYDPDRALADVARLLASPKPKIGHNVAKYDQKVVWKYGLDINNIRWDCLLAEHALEEDKKGQYGLKYLVKQFIPELSGYEDKLHEYLDKEEGENQGDSIKAQQAEKEGEVPLPSAVREALERCDLTPKFQTSNLEKQLERVRTRLANRFAIEETTTFFAQYRIKPPFGGKTFEKKWAALRERAATVKERGLGIPGSEEFAETEVLLVEKLSTVPDLRILEPLGTDETAQFIADAELLIQAKRAGEFQKKSEGKAKKEKDGGFENIPIHELNFYGAVDADATRRLAVIQRQRMRHEDRVIAQRRHGIVFELQHAQGDARKYKLNVLCTTPDPLLDLHRNRYIPRARVLADMEYRGVKIDQRYLQDSKVELDNVINRTEAKIYAMAGAQFKIGSAPQLGRYLFDSGVGFVHPDPEAAAKLVANPDYADKIQYDGTRMMYRFVSKTAKGAVQVNEKTFKTYVTSYDCPFSDLILLYKKALKARDTFLKNLLLLSSLDGYIHTNFNLNGTSTGRLSSNNINLQNIPKGVLGAIVDKNGKLILDAGGKPVGIGVVCKRLFVPDDDSYCLVNADAKGAEVSIFSAYSKDAGLIQALLEGRDAHCYFSAKTLDPAKIGAGLTGEARRVALGQAGIDDDHAWSYDDFYLGKDGKLADKEYGKRLKKLRDNIKRVVFGILFGAGPNKISEIAGISVQLAQTIIAALFEEFKTIPAFVDQTKWELRTFGFVETYHGRRRRFHWNPRTAPKKMLAKAERQAVNFKIQGTNSDIIMDVMCGVNEVLTRDLRGRMLLTVHDSIVFQVPKRYAHQVKDLMAEYGTRRVAQTCPWLPVEFRWDIEAGPSYGKLQGIDDYVAALPAPVPVPDDHVGLCEEEILEDIRDDCWKQDEAEPSSA